MTQQIALAGFMAALVLATGTVQATAQGMGRGPQQVPFAELDANGDGEVTQAEMQAHGQARFDAADTNRDGHLDVAELEARAEGHAKRFVGVLMARADTNGDARLTLDEMRNAMPQRHAVFDDMDTDGSGGLSQAEMDAGIQKYRQGRPGPAPGQG